MFVLSYPTYVKDVPFLIDTMLILRGHACCNMHKPQDGEMIGRTRMHAPSVVGKHRPQSLKMIKQTLSHSLHSTHFVPSFARAANVSLQNPTSESLRTSAPGLASSARQTCIQFRQSCRTTSPLRTKKPGWRISTGRCLRRAI